MGREVRSEKKEDLGVEGILGDIGGLGDCWGVGEIRKVKKKRTKIKRERTVTGTSKGFFLFFTFII